MCMVRPIALTASVLAATPALAAFPGLFPEIVVTRAEAKTEWPFTVDKGELSCINMGQGGYVFFNEIQTEREQAAGKLPRMVVVTTDPVALFASFEDRSLYAPFDTLETLITRLGPYEAIGRDLCASQKKN